MTIQKREHAHIVGKADYSGLSPVQVEMVALSRVAADEADLLVCGGSVAVDDGPSASRGQVGEGAVRPRLQTKHEQLTVVNSNKQ